MDDRQFDAMTRVLGRQSARRGLLQAATGGVLGLAGLSALTGGASARQCRNDNDCPANKVCNKKKDRCVECTSDRNCSGGSICKKNNCVRTCKSNNDCDRNEFCVQKECVECKNDRDCNKGQKCNRKNKCVNK